MHVCRQNLRASALSILFSIGVCGAAMADDAQCGATQADKGSFFEGRTYTASKEFPNITQETAFKKIYAFLVKESWNIGHSDKEMGALSATTDVQAFDAKTAPLNALVEGTPTGSRVSLIFKINMGQYADDAPGYLCKIMSSVTSP